MAATYYHSLAPFYELFGTGLPILTYLKLGPRPRRVRLKGLYVSGKLFTRQLVELREANFTTPPLAEVIQNNGASPQPVVLTFDDGFANVLRHGLEPLARFRFRAIQFLLADLIGKTNEWEERVGEASEPLMDAAQVREWLAAGHAIGSHTLTHPILTRISRGQAREEITTSRKKLEDLFGCSVEHFCYPYGDWNEAVRDLIMGAGYRTACTTDPGIDTSVESLFALKRFTARYPSRNLKLIWARMRAPWRKRRA